MCIRDRVTIKDIPLVNGRKLLRSTFDNIDKAVEWLTENSEAIVEITIVSENSFSDEDGKRLRMAHKRIHCIIPQTSINPNEVSLTRNICLLYTSPSPRDRTRYRMPSSA